MTTARTDLPENSTEPPAVGIRLGRLVGPVAEVHCGLLRWHLPAICTDATARFLNRGTHLLYDQAGLDAAVAAERERCCRVVAVQSDDDRYGVARGTILAIRAGDDFFEVGDCDGLLKAQRRN